MADMSLGVLPPIVAILGPTAVGKSYLAMELAERFRGGIISADSRQVYKLLDIGTAKPTREQQKLIRHHVLDRVWPDGRYTVANFVEDGRAALSGIAARDGVAFVVGGTGHYARTLLQGLTIPRIEPDPARRTRIEQRVEAMGIDQALSEIREVDSVTADRLDRRNVRRVVRAIEIIEATGAPVPETRQRPIPALVIGLWLSRSTIYRTADARVRRQFAGGLIDETEQVLDLGYDPCLPVLAGLAYKQAVDYLTDRVSRDQAIEDYVHATHRLIRRQETWFRAEPRIEWLEATRPGLRSNALRMVTEYLATHRAS